jgi:beta-glucanase (GH16 family)
VTRDGWRRAAYLVGAVAAAAVLAAGVMLVVAPLRGLDRSAPPSATPTAVPPTSAPAAGVTPARPPSPRPSPTNPAPSGVHMPRGNLPGWRQTFSDDFTGEALSARWFRYDGQPAGDPGGWFEPGHVSVGDGKLVIGAWPEPDRRDLYVTGGVSNRNTFSQTYGRFEIRFRAERGTGIAYVALLWPSDNQYPPEIDFAEDNGRDRRTMHGAMHPALAGYANEGRSVSADFTKWHTAGLEWTPGKLVFTLDGEPWATITGPHVPDEPMGLALQTQAWYCGHGWEACPDESTPARVDLEVDWVVCYARE